MLRKIRQGPPGPWTPGTRGRTPLDSPAPCPSGIGCGSIEPAASSGASLPSHGLKIEGVTPVELEEENKTDLPTTPKWQIGLFLWQKVARRETERSAASAKRAATTHRGIPKGAALGAPLVTFPASGKSPGVEGRSALPIGAVGAGGPHFGESRGVHRRCGPSQRDLARRLAKVTPFRYNERKYFLLLRRKTTWEQKNRENKNLIE